MKEKKSTWIQMQRNYLAQSEPTFKQPRSPKDEAMAELAKRYSRWTEKKVANKGWSMKVLQRRVVGVALQVLDAIYGIPFEKLATATYLFCQDVQTAQFTRLYEAQMDLAGANVDKFVKGLHSFFNGTGKMILEKGLFQEFAEFLSLTITVNSDTKESEKGTVERQSAGVAYISLLLQQMQYLNPNKYDFKHIVCGMSTTGEILLIDDVYPLSDCASFEATETLQALNERALKKGKPVRIDADAIFKAAYRKYGIELESLQSLDLMHNADRMFISTIGAMMPYINEYTYDILIDTKNIFQGMVMPFGCIRFRDPYELEELQRMLMKRIRTLPTNGVELTLHGGEHAFDDALIWKQIHMKEVCHGDAIIMLYRLYTVVGELCGFYNTLTREFFSPIDCATEHLAKEMEPLKQLVLYLYACAVCRQGPEMVQRFNQNSYFDLSTEKYSLVVDDFTVELFYMGGKLRNVYAKEANEKRGPTGPRVGQDRYEAGTSAIQGYIRKVGEGRHPSQEAVERAKALGFDLAPDETYVQPFIRTAWKLRRSSID